MRRVIDSSIDLDIRSIIFIGGGETLLYPKIFDLISYTCSKGITSVLFTNGSALGDERLSKSLFKKDCKDVVKFLFYHDVSIILKADTFDNYLYDKIVGRNNAHKVFRKSLANIIEIYRKSFKYSKKKLRIGLAAVLMKSNKKESLAIWKFARNNNLFPHFEPVGYEGRAKKYFKDIGLSKKEAILLYNKLSKIDKEKYNINWDPDIALPAYNCQQLRYSVYISSNGIVQPCNGISIKCGNIRNSNIKNILNHPILKKTRNIYHYINDYCRNCIRYGKCYGCQGRAYNIGGGLFEIDPFCSKKFIKLK